MPSRSSVLALLAATGALACNAVLGIERAEVDPNSLPGGSGGSPGGTGGTGGATGCSAGVSPDAQRVRSCVLWASCDPLLPSQSLSNCLDFGPPTPCLARATSCAQVVACTGAQYETPSPCLGSSGWECAGTRAVNCGVSRVYSIDCAFSGGSCDVTSLDIDANAWPCSPNALPATCSDADTQTHCSGTVAYRCLGGRRYGQECTAYGGSICVEPSPGGAYCTLPAATCSPAGNITCNGSTMTICYDSGVVGTYECSVNGGQCQLASSTEAFCVTPGCTLGDAQACRESCDTDGVTLNLCVGGAAYRTSCAAFGFSQCVSYTHATLGQTVVYCE
jgi:hypothetical protein